MSRIDGVSASFRSIFLTVSKASFCRLGANGIGRSIVEGFCGISCGIVCDIVCGMVCDIVCDVIRVS